VSYTAIQICNLALSHLGDIATVANITAPTTAQERYCATFYPMARDLIMEKHAWSFATVRKDLVDSTVTPPDSWQYAYDLPTGLIDMLAVLDPNSVDDYTTPVVFQTSGISTAPVANLGVVTPQPFTIEYNEAGSKMVLFTNVQDAVGRYVISVTDPARYPMHFVNALAYRLASFLAGPILKGDIGSKVAKDMTAMADKAQMEAEAKDSDERQVVLASGAPWITGRG
jgi:hypothetical protein